ncbi:MAG: HNH endonuclease [Pseudonocardia sp.]|nr:HNH endonuclease [Pseudonocardia sp.]
MLAEESTCWICGDEIDMSLSGLSAMGATGDHIVPVSDGGALLDRDNVRAAHNVCNRRRHVRYKQQKRMEARGR